MRVEAWEAEQAAGVSGADAEGARRAADERELHEGLIEGRAEERLPGDVADVGPRRREYDGRAAAQERRAEEELRVRQVEARQVARVVHLDAAPAVGLEEQLYVIVDSDIKAERYVRDVNVARVSVVVAVGDAEGELTLAERVAVVDGEEPGRAPRRAARADSRRLVARVVARPQGLRGHRRQQDQGSERGKKRSSRESHRIPPAK